MMYRRHRARRLFWIAPFAILGILVFGGIVMLLWNNILSPVLHVSVLSFWQALGILVLSKILFSSFGGGGYRRGNWRQKMMWENLSPEQKEKFRDEWQDWCRRRGSAANTAQSQHGASSPEA
ncbi:MAG: hypothetical protein ACJ75B_17855 [Flavisolibacter sp.]